jgi:hypothetical protein
MINMVQHGSTWFNHDPGSLDDALWWSHARGAQSFFRGGVCRSAAGALPGNFRRSTTNGAIKTAAMVIADIFGYDWKLY